MPDNHPLSVGAACSLALQNADVVLLMGSGIGKLNDHISSCRTEAVHSKLLYTGRVWKWVERPKCGQV